MKMCQPHWDSLREIIGQRGLSALLSEDGERAATNVADQLEQGITIDNFDPLMGAFFAIASNAMEFVGPERSLHLLTGTDCPICYLNEWSKQAWDQYVAAGAIPGVSPCPCKCGNTLPAELPTYDWMIGRAADDQVDVWKSLGSA